MFGRNEMEKLETIARIDSYKHGKRLFTVAEAASIDLMRAVLRYSEEETQLAYELEELMNKADKIAGEVIEAEQKKIACYNAAISLLPEGQSVDRMFQEAELKRQSFYGDAAE